MITIKEFIIKNKTSILLLCQTISTFAFGTYIVLARMLFMDNGPEVIAQLLDVETIGMGYTIFIVFTTVICFGGMILLTISNIISFRKKRYIL